MAISTSRASSSAGPSYEDRAWERIRLTEARLDNAAALSKTIAQMEDDCAEGNFEFQKLLSADLITAIANGRVAQVRNASGKIISQSDSVKNYGSTIRAFRLRGPLIPAAWPSHVPGCPPGRGSAEDYALGWNLAALNFDGVALAPTTKHQTAIAHIVEGDLSGVIDYWVGDRQHLRRLVKTRRDNNDWGNCVEVGIWHNGHQPKRYGTEQIALRLNLITEENGTIAPGVWYRLFLKIEEDRQSAWVDPRFKEYLEELIAAKGSIELLRAGVITPVCCSVKHGRPAMIADANAPAAGTASRDLADIAAALLFGVDLQSVAAMQETANYGCRCEEVIWLSNALWGGDPTALEDVLRGQFEEARLIVIKQVPASIFGVDRVCIGRVLAINTQDLSRERWNAHTLPRTEAYLMTIFPTDASKQWINRSTQISTWTTDAEGHQGAIVRPSWARHDPGRVQNIGLMNQQTFSGLPIQVQNTLRRHLPMMDEELARLTQERERGIEELLPLREKTAEERSTEAERVRENMLSDQVDRQQEEITALIETINTMRRGQ